MELIVINESKLKVILSSDDLDEFSLNNDTLDYSNAETKKMFWDILSRAKKATGFSADGHRVLVQLYPSKSGGCEMFIIKLGPLGGECYCDRKEKEGDIVGIHCKPSHKKLMGNSRTGVFGFDQLSSLLSVCRRLRDIGYEGNSAVYRCDQKKYHLFLDGLDSYSFMPPDEFTFINEYGSVENIETMSYYIEEHGSVICPSNAVEILGVL